MEDDENAREDENYNEKKKKEKDDYADKFPEY